MSVAVRVEYCTADRKASKSISLRGTQQRYEETFTQLQHLLQLKLPGIPLDANLPDLFATIDQLDTHHTADGRSDSQLLGGRTRAGGGGARGPRHGAFEVYVQFAMQDHEETVLVFSKLATKKFPQVILLHRNSVLVCVLASWMHLLLVKFQVVENRDPLCPRLASGTLSGIRLGPSQRRWRKLPDKILPLRKFQRTCTNTHSLSGRARIDGVEKPMHLTGRARLESALHHPGFCDFMSIHSTSAHRNLRGILSALQPRGNVLTHAATP